MKKLLFCLLLCSCGMYRDVTIDPAPEPYTHVLHSGDSIPQTWEVAPGVTIINYVNPWTVLIAGDKKGIKNQIDDWRNR